MNLHAQSLLLVQGVLAGEAALLAPPVWFGVRRCKVEPTLRRAFCKGIVPTAHDLWLTLESGHERMLVLMPLQSAGRFGPACETIARLLAAQTGPVFKLDGQSVVYEMDRAGTSDPRPDE